jgi:hypothetical protein
MVRRVLAAVLLLAGSALVLGCASPTLPLPPPEIPNQGLGTDKDHVLLTAGCGGAKDGAEIIVVNTNTTVPALEQIRGAFASSCGAWQVEIWAHKGDTLDITQDDGSLTSPSTTIQVR